MILVLMTGLCGQLRATTDSIRVYAADSLRGITALKHQDTLKMVIPSNIRIIDTVQRRLEDRTRGRILFDTVSATHRLEVDPFIRFGPSLNVVSFRGLPGVPSCCPSYSTTWGTTSSLGVTTIGAIDESWSWVASADIGRTDVTFQAQEPTTVIVRGVPTAIALQHTLATTLDHVGLSGGMLYRPFDVFTISLLGGFETYLGTHYGQSEQIENAQSIGQFVDTRSNMRNVDEGRITTAVGLRPRLEMRVGARIPLDTFGGMAIAPLVAYTILPSTPVSGTSWATHHVTVGVAASFGLRSVYDVILEIDSMDVIVPSSKPDPGVQLQPVGPWSTEGLRRSFRGVYRTEPLLPYLFFDEGSAVIPDRYRLLTANSAVPSNVLTDLDPSDTLSAYYNILNVVGLRMRENPAATLVITGCNQDAGVERANVLLSNNRAEAVRAYLMGTWKISPGRMKVVARGLPERASVYRDESALADAREENRRVELSSDDPSILADHSMRREWTNVDPPSITFDVLLRNHRGYVNCELSIKGRHGRYDTLIQHHLQNDTTLRVVIPTRALPRVGTRDSALRAVVRVSGVGGSVTSDSTTIAYQSRIASSIESMLSLLLFEYSSTSLDARTIEILKDYALGIDSTARVEVVGHTDRIGDATVNQRLSLERAHAVWQALGIPGAVVVGKGEDDELYGNERPEGRFHNRTVRINISTDK